MEQCITYQKGDQVWVRTESWEPFNCIRLAEILSIMKDEDLKDKKQYITVHYLDNQRSIMYECVSVDRIANSE